MFVYDYDFLNWVPAPMAAYINNRHYSLFPLFPWLAFMLFGGYFASGYIQAREQKKEKEFIILFSLAGALLLAVCFLGIELQSGIHFISIRIEANPLFFFERLAIVMVLLAACWFYAGYWYDGEVVCFGCRQGIIVGVHGALTCYLWTVLERSEPRLLLWRHFQYTRMYW